MIAHDMDNISVFSLQYLSIIVNKITRLYPRFVNYIQKKCIIFEKLNIVFILQKYICRHNTNKKADVLLFSCNTSADFYQFDFQKIISLF